MDLACPPVVLRFAPLDDLDSITDGKAEISFGLYRSRRGAVSCMRIELLGASAYLSSEIEQRDTVLCRRYVGSGPLHGRRGRRRLLDRPGRAEAGTALLPGCIRRRSGGHGRGNGRGQAVLARRRLSLQTGRTGRRRRGGPAETGLASISACAVTTAGSRGDSSVGHEFGWKRRGHISSGVIPSCFGHAYRSKPSAW